MAIALPKELDYLQYRRNVQKALNEKSKVTPPLKVDGDLGAKTIAALQLFQKASQMPVTGLWDETTQKSLGSFITQKYLTLADYQSAAKSLGVDTPSVMSVCEVESRGSGFFEDGQCAILFEPHVFYQQLAKTRTAQALSQLVATYPTIVNPGKPTYLGGIPEYTRLSVASKIDPHLALMSASWGLFQIMGFNFASAGYGNVEAFVLDMKESEGKQLQAFVKFVTTYRQGALLAALRAKNWAKFAEIYNGSNYKQNNYDTKLADNYSTFKGQPLLA
jgi:peptidoglycan hydrolase-like protein with peptidoglycan-binding domain